MDKNRENNYLEREYIIELYRNPSHFKEVTGANLFAEKRNIFCGDKLNVSIRINNGQISDLGFNGNGCILTVVGASTAGDIVLENSQNINDSGFEMEILKRLGLEKITPARLKCVMLGAETIKEALRKERSEKQK